MCALWGDKDIENEGRETQWWSLHIKGGKRD